MKEYATGNGACLPLFFIIGVVKRIFVSLDNTDYYSFLIGYKMNRVTKKGCNE